MDTEDTPALLRRYAGEGSESAFVELMERYVDLVYGAALRRLNGDSGLAQDVVQRVFMELSRDARKLRAEAGLGGWLYRRAVHLAADMHKSECRRRAREQLAFLMTNGTGPGPAPGTEAAAWTEATPLLDEAMGRLSTADRNAVVLRFFENRTLRSVGDALGVSEDAAQKRLSRALEKLRRLLLRRGVACTAGGLAVLLSKNAASAAPAGLLRAVWPGATASAAGGTAAKTAAGAAALFSTLAMKPSVIVAVTAAAVAGLSIPLLLHQNDEASPSGPVKNASTPARPAGPLGSRRAAPEEKNAAAKPVPGRQAPPVALLPGLTEEEREAILKNSRARAEKVTEERFQEKMERLRRKLSLTPEQDEKITAHHRAQRGIWVEYLTASAVGEADPKYYHLEVSYRPDVPPALVPMLSPAQQEALKEHDAVKRANYLETTTNGELGSLALKLELAEAAKEGLFQRLSAINSTDLFGDYTGITDLAGISRQADMDVQRRREAYAEVLDATQMKEWEAVVANYKTHLLRRFGHREPPAAASTAKPEGNAG